MVNFKNTKKRSIYGKYTYSNEDLGAASTFERVLATLFMERGSSSSSEDESRWKEGFLLCADFKLESLGIVIAGGLEELDEAMEPVEAQSLSSCIAWIG